jgi:DNA-binding beta-propeller fold protein YncE
MPASIQGRFDHLAVDVPGNRLFVTAESAHEVLIFDLSTGEYLRSITRIETPHAIHISNRLYITDGGITDEGGAGALKIYDRKTYRLLKALPLEADADSIGYDPSMLDLYVVNGGRRAHQSFSVLSVVNTTSDSKVADIRIDGSILEAMAIARSSPLLYENNRSMRQIDVINRRTRTVEAVWPVDMCQDNVALALDESSHRLFTACRNGIIAVFDTQTGKQLESLPIAEGVDDLIFDPERKRLYASCRSGSVDVFHEQDPDNYVLLGRIPSAPGGKNEVFAPSLGRLYITIPPLADEPGEIYVYQVE